MKCPECDKPDSFVIDSRAVTRNGGGIRRRRQCSSCNTRYTTFEAIVDADTWQFSPDAVARIRELLLEINGYLPHQTDIKHRRMKVPANVYRSKAAAAKAVK